MESDKNPFLEMSQDQIKKLDEVLQSDQAKALFEEAAKKLLETSKPLPIGSNLDDRRTILCMEGVASLSNLSALDIEPGSATGLFNVCDEVSVSTASETFHGPPSSLSIAELILLEHNYFIKPALDTQTIKENVAQNVGDTKNVAIALPPTSPLPTRRSQRQIEKIERTQVEKIKTVSDELQRKETKQLEKQRLLNEETQSIDRSQLISSNISESEVKLASKKQLSTKVNTSEAKNQQPLKSDETEETNEAKEKTNIPICNISYIPDENNTCSKLRKSKKLDFISSDQIDIDNKSLTILCKEKKNSPSKLSKRKLSPRKTISSSSLEEKQFSKLKKCISVVDEENDNESNVLVKVSRRRTISASSYKLRCSPYQQKSPEQASKGRRKKRFSSFEDNIIDHVETQAPLKKRNLIDISKDLSDEQDGKACTLQVTPSASVPKAKIQKKVKKESISLGFEPALFSQPDVMVKVKNDDSPTKKTDKESTIFEELADKTSAEPLSTNEKETELDSQLSELDSGATIKHTEFNNDVCLENEPVKDSENNSANLSNILNDKPNLQILTDPVINKNICILSETEQLPSSPPNIESAAELQKQSNSLLESETNIMQQSVLHPAVDEKPNLQLNTDSLPELSSNSPDLEQNKITELSVSNNLPKVNNSPKSELNVSQSSLGSTVLHENVQEFVDDEHTDEPDILNVNENDECDKLPSPVPERKSRRVIKRKEFFEEISYQGNKRTSKKNAEPPDVKKTSGKRIKKLNENDAPLEIYESEEEDELEDSDWSSEDDPEKLWCICRKPHNHRFMIQCDSCEDWFHGSCVGVSRQQGRQLEKLKKEWKCPNCMKGEPAAPVSEKGLSSNSISAVKRDTEPKKSVKRNYQDFKKSKKQFTSLDKDLGVKKTLKRTSELHKHLSKEGGTKRKNGEFVSTPNDALQTKHSAVDREKYANKRNPTVKNSKGQNQKPPVATTLNTQLKTIIPQKNIISSSSNISNKKMVPLKDNSQKSDEQSTIIVKGSPSPKDKVSKDTKKRSNCVSCEKLPTLGSCYCSHTCIEKHVNDCLKMIRESKITAKAVEPSSQRLVVFDRHKGTVIAGENSPTADEIIPWLKLNPNFMIACTSSDNHGKPDSADEKLDNSDRREDSDENAKETVRLNVRKTLKNILEERCKNADDINVSEEDVQRISMHIEEELHSLFRDNTFKYRAKYRSLMFNIKDPRNQGLFRKILKGKIPPDRLVKMSTDELASVELAKWREQENQHCLDMIKRVQLEQLKTGGTLLIKKTHKGEVEIEGEAASVIEQDIPKTPVKVEEDILEVDIPEFQEIAKDTTHLHRSHLFDLNCKICTGKMAPPPTEDAALKKIRVAHSISVDCSSPTTLDPLEKSVSRVVDGKSPGSSAGDDSVDNSVSKVSTRSVDLNEV